MKQKPEDTEAKLDETRKKFFEESRFDPNNQKYGLFSFSGTLAISDKPYFNKTVFHKTKNNNGKTTAKHENSITKSSKHRASKSYFSLPEYKSDEYIEPINPYLIDKLKDDKRRNYHEVAWKPGGSFKEKLSLFSHEPSGDLKKPSKKGSDGLILIGPKNFYTMPTRVGSAMTTPGVLIGGNNFEYIPDPYDRKQKMLSEEKKNHLSKMPKAIFKPPNPGNKPFVPDKIVYRVVIPKKKLKKAPSQPQFYLPRPFIPSHASKPAGPIGKYPEHIADPFISPKRRPSTEQIPWRHTTNLRSRPSPSVSYSCINLRSEYSILRNHH